LNKKIIIILFGILFVTVGTLVYIGQKNNQNKELYYSGTIDTTQANLSFQVAGRVACVHVQEGQTVTQNQIVAELDRKEFESRYAQAKANLERALKSKQQMETMLEVSRKTLPPEVARAQAIVQSARDTLKDAEKTIGVLKNSSVRAWFPKKSGIR